MEVTEESEILECKKTGSPPRKSYVLGIPVSVAEFNVPKAVMWASACREAVIITFVNPHACHVATTCEEYLAQLEKFDWVLCDGIGMVLAANRLEKMAIPRAAFDLTSIAGHVFECLAKIQIPVVLVGGRIGVAETAAREIRVLYPHLEILATFSGYDSDPIFATEYLSNHKHVAVICGMGAPRQEQFLLRLKEIGWRGIGFTCGGFLDQIGVRRDYYPGWVDHCNLRFAYRLMKEPRRLWRRYLIEYQTFISRFLKAMLT